MFRLLDHRAGHYALLGSVAAWLFLVNLGGASLWDVDEGRNTVAALEMLESGDWVVPTFNGALRVDKPALLYWLQIVAYRTLGVNEFAARLPSALAALGTVLLTYELGRRMFNPPTALLGGLVLASTPMVCAAARFANPDALLNALTALTMLLFWRGFAGSGRWWFVAVGLSSGLAVLAKGPVGLVLPGAVLVLFLFWSGQLGRLRDRRLVLGGLAFMGVALPWYVRVGVETKAGFLRGFWLTHNVDRFLSPLEDHRGSPLYYPAVLVVGFAPWSVFLALTLWYALPRRRPEGAESGSGADGAESATRLLWCWIGVYLAFFSLAATKLPNYILPVYPPLALLTGRFLDRWRRGEVTPPAWLLHLSLASLGLVGIAVMLGLWLAGGGLPPDGAAAWLHGRCLPGLEPWAGLGVLPVLGAAAGWWFLRRQRRTGLVATVTAAAVLFLGPLAAWGSVALNRHKAPQPLVRDAGALCRDRDIRIGAYQLEYLPSLNFYCQRSVQHQKDEAGVRDFLRTPLPVYLFVPAPVWDGLRATVRSPHRVLARHHDLYRNWDVLVVTNR
jgi:4-amino-4-deoxy-L-arabinose transferase-like glycosyltransferase